MVTSEDCRKKYGPPENEKFMVFHDLSLHQATFPSLPKRIYCNQDLINPLEKALNILKRRGWADHIKTWDGCFNIRKKRGAHSASLHSWGVAIDINAAWNRFGEKPTMSILVVEVFKDAGFDWGGEWLKPDGMHFQLSKI